MITIIAGSRNITDYSILEQTIKQSQFNITKIISGGAKGVDTLAIKYALKNKIPFEIIPAEWDKYGKSAGYIRNEEMAKKADGLIAIWDGKSKGTKHMINLAKKYNLKIFLFAFKKTK